jgi:hypothetical protein
MIPTWQERCEKFDDGKIITYAMINEKMQEEIDELRKELALQKLSDISQEIEDRDSAIYATGYWNGIAKAKPRELTDEEIYDCFKIPKDKRNTAQSDYNIFGCREVAMAILKKASEK